MSSNYLSLNYCDLGFNFQTELDAAKIWADACSQLKEKYVEFIKVLLTELVKRMPTHLSVFEQVRNFSPNIILNPITRSIFSKLPLHNMVSEEKISDIEIQYRNILNTHWTSVFGEKIPEDCNIKRCCWQFNFYRSCLIGFKSA